jgi:hypothetical protein
MNQQPPAQKPITYFIVTPETFQAVANKLATMPYQEVAGLMQDFAGTSRAMFDEPPSAKPPAPVDERPGWTLFPQKSTRKNAVQEYDNDKDSWWVKDPPILDTGKPGGAE